MRQNRLVEVNVIPFNHSHFKALEEMLYDQKCPWINEITYGTLPKTGYIAFLGKQPIASGFLRRLEGGYAQFDTFVTNPHFGSKVRNDAINFIVNALMEDAKSLKLKGILAVSEDKGIISRAKLLGFQEIKQTLLGLKL